MKIKNLDHLVLTVNDIEETCKFYTEILGMEVVVFGNSRKALKFGNQKINLHQRGNEFEPKADSPTVGSADLCFIVETPIDAVVKELKDKNINIIDGIVERTGANGKICSVYIRDNSNNLIELSNYI